MATRRELTVISAKRKGTTALVAGVATIFLSVLLFKLFWILGLIGLGVGSFLTVNRVKQWLRFRGENGLYFK